jgi:hypothetical protein
MDRTALEAIIDGMIYDVIADLDSEHVTFIPSRIAMQLASLIMDKVEKSGWRSPEQIKAMIQPWEDEARARRGVRAGCTI